MFVDYMVGWLYSCLHDANLVPKVVTNQVQGDPRAEYASFMGTSLDDTRVAAFNEGFGNRYLAPQPLLPPGKTVF
jgi:hypothetical protein